ncbi:hypothetical protein GWI33_013500 [Rhynchophorus ferrugineus]|uniref:Protein zwilch n=1 Tax=Rhynchophorus ferrugineus TaxID=354439 RepID=A0A834M7S8_RHYFE|nr:hypothetical protein GWI33_013500 [Rhynchophorus ferrugineus]
MNPDLVHGAEVPVLSYLIPFEEEFKRIQIIYSKKPSIASDCEDIQVPIQTTSQFDNSLNECDLTGDPLKVDLGGNDDSVIIKEEEVINSWSTDEAKYCPLSVTEARRELNNILKNTKNESEQALPCYAICDGKDPHHTVLLGCHGHSFTSYCLQILDIISKNDAVTELDNMIKYHKKACSNNSVKINYVSKMDYNIYGRNLKKLSNQNASMRNFDYHASVSVNINCNECIFNMNDGRNANIMMNLQLVAGHRLLSMNFLWQEMHLLQSYLDILLDCDVLDNTILCKNPLESDEILRRIEKLVDKRFLRYSSEKTESIDLEHLREGDLDFLDELWNILKYCDNASTLRNSLHFLFEEITASNNRSMMIRDKTSNIAQLIEGAHKLKHDFQAILNQFSSTVRTNIDKIWKSLFQMSHLSQAKSRTTRVTQSIQHSHFDMKIKQLAYLSQMYVGAEFIYIVKEQVTLQENTFYYFCECIEKEFIHNSTKYIDFMEIFQSPLCEMSLQLDSRNIGIIQNLLPTNWTMHMSSKVGGTTIITTYNLTESSLFPPCVYDYDVPSSEEVYFMSRMKKIKGMF